MNVNRGVTKYWAIVLVIITLGVMRLSLINKGYFYFQDELRYRYSLAFVREIGNLNFREAGRQLFEFNLYARPGLVLINIPVVLIQVVLLVLTGLKTETPTSLLIFKVVQVMVSLGISWLVFWLSRRWLKSFLAAFTVLVVYGLLMNTNLYLRHIVPYEIVLAGYLLLLTWVVKNYQKISGEKLATLSGFGVAGLHTVYPTYYSLGLITGWLVTFLPGKKWWRRGLIFTASFILILALVELAARIYGKSYFADMVFTTTRVVVGSPEETFIFLWRYLAEVEGLIGKILIGLGGGFVVHLMIAHRKYSRELALIMSGVISAYLIHAVSGPLAGKVYYGRMMHMFYPFLVIGSVAMVEQLTKKLLKQMVYLGLVIVAIYSFARWYVAFLPLEYPRDILFSYCGLECANQVMYLTENYPPEVSENYTPKQPQFLAWNFTNLYPVSEKLYQHSLPKGAKLLIEAPHPLNFIAYQWEWNSIEERSLLTRHQFIMRLYALDDKY